MIMEALPSIQKEIDRLPREYVGNIIQTLAGNAFTQWVRQKIESRNAKLQQERQMTVAMDQSILDIFNASNAISGKCYLPCKPSIY